MGCDEHFPQTIKILGHYIFYLDFEEL